MPVLSEILTHTGIMCRLTTMLKSHCSVLYTSVLPPTGGYRSAIYQCYTLNEKYGIVFLTSVDWSGLKQFDSYKPTHLKAYPLSDLQWSPVLFSNSPLSKIAQPMVVL